MTRVFLCARSTFLLAACCEALRNLFLSVLTIDQFFRCCKSQHIRMNSLHHASAKTRKLMPLPLLAVRCPQCGAQRWESCETTTGLPRTFPHRGRLSAALEPKPTPEHADNRLSSDLLGWPFDVFRLGLLSAVARTGALRGHSLRVGCALEECVFVATGASIFHGARLLYNSEVRVNAVVHLRTTLPAHTTVPIGWVAVGDPARLFSPDQHEEIWKVQEPLNFPEFVYSVARSSSVGHSNMPEITTKRSKVLGSHKQNLAADIST